MYSYHMPTILRVGDIKNFSEDFKGYGNKAFIITGKSSEKNGVLKDVTDILTANNTEFLIFNEIEENPSLETLRKASELGKKEKIDFIIGIGGGSPQDSAKGVGILIKNPDKTTDDLYLAEKLYSVPILLIPTTAGTGSETTPYAVFTDHSKATKIAMSQSIFAEKAFLDSKYTWDMPDNITLSTALDAFAHLVEGYTAKNANFMSDRLVESGLIAFSKCIKNLEEKNFDKTFREEILAISSLAGIVISQTKTSLPHQLSYAITYNKHVPHGFACCLFMTEYFKLYMNNEKENSKIANMLKFIGFKNLAEFDSFMQKTVFTNFEITNDEILEYTKPFDENKDKLKNFPFEINAKDIENLYRKSLKKYII